MSGGPALTQAGRVVGVNVATEGEQISYLVPAERVFALLERTVKVQDAGGEWFSRRSRQVRSTPTRRVILPELFLPKTPSVTLGPYSLTHQAHGFFSLLGRCAAP